MSENTALIADIVELMKRHPEVKTIRVEDPGEPNVYFYVTRVKPVERILMWSVHSYEVEPGYWCYTW